VKTYDITTVDRTVIRDTDAAEDITSLDLRQEMMAYLAAGHEDAEFLRAGAYNAVAVEVIYFPDSGRAGIAWGADASWTDADSVQDGLERYFGIGGKEMVE
jgi:hypothetical protein